MINRDSAAAILRLLAGAFPVPAMTEDQARIYLDRMTSPPFADVDILLGVAEACVDMLDRMPTLHQIVEAYQAEARHRMSLAQEADQRALDRAGAARGGPRPDGRMGREMVDVLRTALAEAIPVGDETRGHDHHQGAAGCPVCSRKAEIAATFEHRVAELLTLRRVVPVPQPVRVARCSNCHDNRVVVVDDDPATFSVRPCPECQPEAAEAWAAGKFMLRRGVTR